MKIMILIIISMILQLFSRDNFSISNFGDQIYILNGFDKELSLFNRDLTLNKKISLKNVSQSGFFDFFIKFDKFKSYSVDSENGIIYLLDENMALKRSSDIKSSHGIRIYKKVFPVTYNSLLIASYEKDRIYILENNVLKERLSFDDTFIDIYADSEDLYVLFQKAISVYSPQGVFKNSISIDKEKKYDSIVKTKMGLFIRSEDEITFFSFSEKKFEHIKNENISCFTAIDSMIYYFSGDSLKLKAVKL